MGKDSYLLFGVNSSLAEYNIPLLFLWRLYTSGRYSATLTAQDYIHHFVFAFSLVRASTGIDAYFHLYYASIILFSVFVLLEGGPVLILSLGAVV